MPPSFDDIFERPMAFPDSGARDRRAQLVGLEDQKERLSKILRVLTNPGGLEAWADQFHPEAKELVNRVLRRSPLVVLAGDVGTGKTELASTIGDAVARQEGIDVTLLPMSLSARGQGRVGEMTQLITAAFEFAVAEAEKVGSNVGAVRGAVILLVDEADAIAQSREGTQMHHEDRAGVNAFIRGVDRLARACLPAAVITCTNRHSALDPAVKRRAAEVLFFERPDAAQRRAAVQPALLSVGLSEADVEAIVTATGPTDGRGYGYTYSDLTQRLLPRIVLDAYPEKPVSASRALEVAVGVLPTPPFNAEHP